MNFDKDYYYSLRQAIDEAHADDDQPDQGPDPPGEEDDPLEEEIEFPDEEFWKKYRPGLLGVLDHLKSRWRWWWALKGRLYLLSRAERKEILRRREESKQRLLGIMDRAQQIHDEKMQQADATRAEVPPDSPECGD